MTSDRPGEGADFELVEEAFGLVGFRDIWRSNILHAGVELGLFESVDENPKDPHTIADQKGTDPEYTSRLLRALAHYGVMAEDEDCQYTLTDLGRLFLPYHPQSVSPVVRFFRSDQQREIWTYLPDIVEDGGPTGNIRAYGMRGFDYFEEHPALAEAFNGSMRVGSQLSTPEILDGLDGYDFSEVAKLCDIGGSHGYLLCSFLARHPHLEGVVLDLPNVIEEEDRHWAQDFGVADRCDYVAGDMFESVPEADAYLIKSVLHDWNDEECVDILETAREASPSTRRMLVIEPLMPPPGETDGPIPSDINMMVSTGGRERTLSEFKDLLAEAGWSYSDTWEPEEGSYTVIEAQKG